ncbi:GTP-binding protein [Mycena epipterygia]|nr:GTP-binding protein [Mycena epipterygia]
MDKAIDLRSKCGHFRILIIGRANAGKTTILKKVCKSIEDPEIFSPSGKKRGLHDIENQLIFKSNPQFIFHDSRGFESGSVDEMEKVKSFIQERARSQKLSEQPHAVWYCVPTDTDRPLLEADEQFFKMHGSGSVPVVAIFTKFDGLVTKSFNELRRSGTDRPRAHEQKVELAQERLNTNFLEPLMSTKSPPSDHVQLDDMRKDSSSCVPLIEKTANVLNDDTLKLLFVSVQRNNIDVCTRYAIK